MKNIENKKALWFTVTGGEHTVGPTTIRGALVIAKRMLRNTSMGRVELVEIKVCSNGGYTHGLWKTCSRIKTKK